MARGIVWIGALLLPLLAAGGALAQTKDFYFRVEGGYDASNNNQFLDRKTGSANALLGIGDAVSGDSGSTAMVGGAVGYQITPYLRTDASFGYRPDFRFTGIDQASRFSATSKFDNMTGFVNLYLDFAGIYDRLGVFEPFIGFGGGISYSKLEKFTFTGRGTTITTPGGEQASGAFAATVGTGIRITPVILLDLTYRYLDLGRLETDVGTGRAVPPGRNFAADAISASLTAHEVTAGIRYRF
jgi:opacity protein-like surface antigen